MAQGFPVGAIEFLGASEDAGEGLLAEMRGEAGLAARQTKASRGAPIDERNVRATACPGPRPLARVPSGVGLLSFELTRSSAISSSPDAEFNAQVRVIAAN